MSDLAELAADLRRVVLDTGDDAGFDLRAWIADALVTLPDYVRPVVPEILEFEDFGF